MELKSRFNSPTCTSIMAHLAKLRPDPNWLSEPRIRRGKSGPTVPHRVQD